MGIKDLSSFNLPVRSKVNIAKLLQLHFERFLSDPTMSSAILAYSQKCQGRYVVRLKNKRNFYSRTTRSLNINVNFIDSQ